MLSFHIHSERAMPLSAHARVPPPASERAAPANERQRDVISDGARSVGNDFQLHIDHSARQLSQRHAIQVLFRRTPGDSADPARPWAQPKALVQRQVLSKLVVAPQTQRVGPLARHYYFIADAVIAGRTPSPFTGTMGAHSTAWVAHIDAVRRCLIGHDIRDGLNALLDLASGEIEHSELSELVPHVDSSVATKAVAAQKQLQTAIDISDQTLKDMWHLLDGAQPLGEALLGQALQEIRQLIDRYLTLVNYMPGSTVPGGDPAGHGEGTARGKLNLHEYMVATHSAEPLNTGAQAARLKKENFEGAVRAHAEAGFRAGEAADRLGEMVRKELWTLFAIETPEVFEASLAIPMDSGAEAKPKIGRTWKPMIRNFLKTIAAAYPHSFKLTRMHEADSQIAGLQWALAKCRVQVPGPRLEAVLQWLRGGALGIDAAPADHGAGVAESDFFGGGSGFQTTVLLDDTGKVGAFEAVGRSQSPFKRTMGAHTVAWVAHLDAVRAALVGKTPIEAMNALMPMAEGLSSDSSLWFYNMVDEQQQEFIVQGLAEMEKMTQRAKGLAKTSSAQGFLDFLEAYAWQYLTTRNFLPLSTIETGSVPGGRREGAHRTFLVNFEQNPIEHPSMDQLNDLKDHMRGLFDPTAVNSFPPSRLAPEELVFEGSEEEQRSLKARHYELRDNAEPMTSRTKDATVRQKASKVAKAQFIETIQHAYPECCAALRKIPWLKDNLYDLIA